MSRMPATLIGAGIGSGRYIDCVTECPCCHEVVNVTCRFCGCCLDCCGNGFECPSEDDDEEEY